MTRDEVADLLGIKPNSVRDTLRRYGITEQRGYLRAAVESLERPGRGRRRESTGSNEEPQR
jgi:predicted ArsR family transcriptional regulator